MKWESYSLLSVPLKQRCNSLIVNPGSTTSCSKCISFVRTSWDCSVHNQIIRRKSEKKVSLFMPMVLISSFMVSSREVGIGLGDRREMQTEQPVCKRYLSLQKHKCHRKCFRRDPPQFSRQKWKGEYSLDVSLVQLSSWLCFLSRLTCGGNSSLANGCARERKGKRRRHCSDFKGRTGHCTFKAVNSPSLGNS